MISHHKQSARALGVICCGLLATVAFAQNKDVDQKIDPSKTKTSHSESKDTQTDETKYFDKDGQPVKTEKTTVTPEGKVKETEVYRENGLTDKTTVKTDNSGKEVQTNTETYKDGVMIAGTITGPGVWKVFNRDTGQYENWKPVKPFSQVPGPYEPPKTTGPQKTSPTPAGQSELKTPKISGQLQIPYEYKFKSDEKGAGNTTGQAPQQPTLNQVAANGFVKVAVTGTGETIGHIADARLENVSAQAVGFYFPPSIVESKSGKGQDFLSPYGQDVALQSGETKTVPLNGICLERDRPPVAQGASGDLMINDGDPRFANAASHFPPAKVQEALRVETAIYNTVGEMANHEAFKNFPVSDKEERINIVLQWSTWMNPRLAEITGGHPATKDDMKEVVKKQQKGKISSATEKKIDKGVDTMWEQVELAGAKAKDVEPAQSATPSPAPTSQAQ